MCYRPLRIMNNSPFFNPSIDRLYQTVPCGECEECRSMSQSQWALRSLAEWKDCEAHGGYSVFLTFTFNEKYLPRVRVMTPQGLVNIPCFDRKLVQNFLKRLRKDLDKQGVTGLLSKYNPNATNSDDKYEYNQSLRYIWCSEFGKLHGRPHHHVQFFVGRGIVPSAFVSLCKKHWSVVVEDIDKVTGKKSHHLESLGFISVGRLGALVQSPMASLYCTKYVTKDLDYVKNFGSLFDYSSRYFAYEHAQQAIRLYRDTRDNKPKDTLETQRLLANRSRFVSLLDGNCVFPVMEQNTYDRCMSLQSSDLFGNMRTISKPVETINITHYCTVPSQWHSLIDSERDEVLHYYHKNCFPFHLQSMNFGIKLLDDDTLDKQNMTISVVSSKGSKTVPVPLYIYRKLCYTMLPDVTGKKTIYRLNKLGVELAISKLDSKIEKFVNDYGFITCSDELAYLISNNNDTYKFATGFDLNRFLKSIHYSPDVVRSYAIYRYVYDGLLHIKDDPLTGDYHFDFALTINCDLKFTHRNLKLHSPRWYKNKGMNPLHEFNTNLHETPLYFVDITHDQYDFINLLVRVLKKSRCEYNKRINDSLKKCREWISNKNCQRL